MGNCLRFCIPFNNNDHDDTARLAAGGNEGSGSRRRSHESSYSHSGEERSRRHRNIHPSSYVNELYVSSTLGAGEAENAENEAEKKRKARVKGLLEQIPIDVYKDGSNADDECAICMIDFVPNDQIRYLPCKHAYHVKCIDDWLLRSFTCPSCMEPVDSALLAAFTMNTNVDLTSFSCSPAAVCPSSSTKY